MKTLIRNATLIYGGGTKAEDILIEHGRIREVRSSIAIRGDETLIDGTSFYVLPGFISENANDPSLGVTTRIKTVRLSDPQQLKENESLNTEDSSGDYVYRVSLPVLTKEVFQFLMQKRIKVIRLEGELGGKSHWSKLDWEVWEQRMLRAGIVADMDENDFSYLSGLSIPLLIPYEKWRKSTRPRTIFRVTDGTKAPWKSQMSRMDPVVMGAYWLDAKDTFLPKLEKEIDVLKYLGRLAYVRSRLPAKMFGIYPVKGSISVGADADLLFVSKDSLLLGSSQSLQWRTMVKGIFLDEQMHSENNRGQFLIAHQTYAYAY
ncbi:hypothetical protein [Ammoniphilus sp. 3BR4]|uniref:hypothetical protein n=1 Tax=Ammoniphilus sp. 3BR4 TaxID=3158265 RepID=UPI003466C9AF